MGIAQVVDYYLELVERMGREIDANQFALLVQPLNVAPQFALRYRRCGYFYFVFASKERILHLLLLCLVELSVTHECVEERLTLIVLGEEIFTAY